ncbi:MAG: hypothetical protein KatS3mg076_0837 [Candidatus Binatia bacterium]|nr:MAG: hypothetical protein KatS3mg076_0837 [Candidatus Binatia bacterium]
MGRKNSRVAFPAVSSRSASAAWLAVFLFLPFLGASESLAFRATVGGKTVDLDGTLEFREVFEVDEATPEDRTLERLRLRVGVDWAEWLSFDSTTVVSHGGPVGGATGGGIFDLDDAFQDLDPSVDIDEAFLDFRFGALLVRAGKQKFFWGKLDREQPNDLLNPRRFDDPVLREAEERKIGVPALSFDYAFPTRSWLPEETRVVLAWVPAYVPFRLPRPGSRWFPPAAEPRQAFSLPPGFFSLPDGSPSPALEIPLELQVRNVSPPARTLENGSFGLRLSGFTRGVDFALYFFRGFDNRPAVALRSEASLPEGLPSFDPSLVTARNVIEPVFRRVEAWGGDAAYTLGDVTLRAEAAYVRGRPFVRDLRFLLRDPAVLRSEIERVFGLFASGATRVEVRLPPSFVEKDSVEWGVGGDYLYEGWFFLLQFNQTDILRNEVDLLLEDVETRVTAEVRKNFWRDRVRIRLVGFHGIEGDYTAWLPRISYFPRDWIEIQGGYVALFGRTSSVLGQFKDHDQGYVLVRVEF